MAKDKFYFQHDSNARGDLKILSLRQRLGWEGYGIYWAFLEILREQDGYKIPSQAKASLMLALSLQSSQLDEFVQTCLDIGLLVEKDGFLYSESFILRMAEIDERRAKLSEAGRRGGLISSHAQASLKQPSSSKVKESKVKQIKVNNYDFNLIWSKYPKRDGRKGAEKHFQASVKTDEDWENINKALDNYLKTDTVQKGFIKNGSTWFNNWRDWIEVYKLSQKPLPAKNHPQDCPECWGSGLITSPGSGKQITCFIKYEESK